MNMQKFAERWQKAHPNNNYLAPFLGGPVDELFITSMTRNMTIGKQRVINWHPYKPRTVYRPQIVPAANLFLNQANTSVPHLNNDGLSHLTGCWLRIDNVSEKLFHLTYYFFARLGTLHTMRAFNEKTFYLLYKNTRDTQRALDYNETTVVIFDNTVTLHVVLLEQSEIDKIYSRFKDVDNEDADNSYDPYCTERFVYEDEYQQEYCERHSMSNYDIPKSGYLWCYNKQNAMDSNWNNNTSANKKFVDVNKENSNDFERIENNGNIERMKRSENSDNPENFDAYRLAEISNWFMQLFQFKGQSTKVWLWNAWNWIKFRMVTALLAKVD